MAACLHLSQLYLPCDSTILAVKFDVSKFTILGYFLQLRKSFLPGKYFQVVNLCFSPGPREPLMSSASLEV